MKKNKIFIAAFLFTTQLTTAQVLYSENFDNLTLGNVGTDFTGVTAGQGGWYTLSQSSEIPSENSNNYFKIVAARGRGKVLELAATPGKGQIFFQKRGIDALWNNRKNGNNILKIEIDFYTGDQFSNGGNVLPFQGAIIALKPNDIYDATSNDVVGSFAYRPDMESVNVYTASKTYYIVPNLAASTIKLQTWVKLIYYLDFQNQRIYFVIPSNNFFSECLLDPNTTVKSFLLKSSNWIGSPATVPHYKYDNLVISAVDTTPLSTRDFISEKFNLYPNPAKNVVNITNNENINIEQIKVYDINNKLIETKIYTNEFDIQLNVSTFATGTYLLHIYTTEGVAFKKVVKN